MLIYALDIGGSSIKHGFIDPFSGFKVVTKDVFKEKELLKPLYFTGQEFKEVQEKVFFLLKKALIAYPTLEIVALSTAGAVNKQEIVLRASYWRGYENVSWEKLIFAQFPQIKQVKVANDGLAAAWGEHFQEKNKEKISHLHLTIGTGIGAGFIYKNNLLVNKEGLGSYLGQIKLFFQEKERKFEELASAKGILAYYQKNFFKKEKSFRCLVSLAAQGDKNAQKTFKQGGYWLGKGMGLVLNVLNPDLVTLGGGVILAAEENFFPNFYWRAVMKGLKQSVHPRIMALTNIKTASLKEKAALIGVARLAMIKTNF